MLKEERFQKILELIQRENIIKISDVTKLLDVTEMTVRRDLKYLEGKGLLIRIHGGAKKKTETLFKELSHNEKRKIHVEEKKYIAKLAADLIHENDIVYVGPGTTNEYIYDYINVSYAKIITNSMSIFSKFRDDKRFELILVGGRFRSRTDVFVGNFTNEILHKIRVKTAFVGTNGIYENNITTSNEEEGVCQGIILNNSSERYILCDSSKINKEDFYSFYDLNEVTAIITDNKINEALRNEYEDIVRIINK
ncbi:DeoR/GlpR family DNA-binding transcription regulator [Clostridium sp. Marseille-Q2269]|uniref:DeoR/GlpR family DNA-binding transcription regulator n=1 Tax=Clostridium sp. Marseille-Q2269 TaxID=2942205 RepID=UPI0020738BCD|nr:DeoR/GlpR family DNA-binding transcription regulator [Clostridium sp. Marseille-Q2269]